MRDFKTGKPCLDCGRGFPPEAMHWDHRPGTEKLGEVSTIGRRRSIAMLMDELNKCDLVCANCHAIRTYARLHADGEPRIEESVLVYCA